MPELEHTILMLRRRNADLRAAISRVKQLLDDAAGQLVSAEARFLDQREAREAAHQNYRRQLDARLYALSMRYQRKLKKLTRDPVKFVRDSRLARNIARLTRWRP